MSRFCLNSDIFWTLDNVIFIGANKGCNTPSAIVSESATLDECADLVYGKYSMFTHRDLTCRGQKTDLAGYCEEKDTKFNLYKFADKNGMSVSYNNTFLS